VPDVPTQSPPDTGHTYRKRAGMVPLPGYTLIEPLGKGGFGEVWKCEAPGGLLKAVKFVANDADAPGSNSLEVEYEAFQHIKTIRHPFLLNLERVELLGSELVMVMELADHQLQDHFRNYTGQGYPGIPRDDLIGYLSDAAEMLDHIGSRHGLQHLDIKPANLFLVCERVKVGDFGLVRRHELSPELRRPGNPARPRRPAVGPVLPGTRLPGDADRRLPVHGPVGAADDVAARLRLAEPVAPAGGGPGGRRPGALEGPDRPLRVVHGLHAGAPERRRGRHGR
jgi:serine/threonine protein kinase